MARMGMGFFLFALLDDDVFVLCWREGYKKAASVFFVYESMTHHPPRSFFLPGRWGGKEYTVIMAMGRHTFLLFLFYFIYSFTSSVASSW